MHAVGGATRKCNGDVIIKNTNIDEEKSLCQIIEVKKVQRRKVL